MRLPPSKTHDRDIDAVSKLAGTLDEDHAEMGHVRMYALARVANGVDKMVWTKVTCLSFMIIIEEVGCTCLDMF